MRVWTGFGLVALAVGCAFTPAFSAEDGRTLQLVAVRADASTPPRALEAAGAAQYPATAIGWRREGRAVVAATVTADGRVERVALYKSSGYASLDRAAIAHVREQRFAPATRDGIAVAIAVHVPVSFELAGR